MNTADSQILIDMPKLAVGWSGFVARDNHAGHLIGSAQLTDANGVYIAGLTLDIEIKQSAVSDQCLFHFSIRQRRSKLREVVYQLEVAPKAKRTHNGKIPIYGPHQHIGNEEEPIAIDETDVNCGNWDGCVTWFLSKVNVANLQVEKPC